MLNSVLRAVFKPQIKAYCTAVSQAGKAAPILIPATKEYPNKYQLPRQAWIENFDTVEQQNLGIIELHPDVFGKAPRIDIIHQNVEWQRKYRYVSFAHTKVRSEVRGGGRKPWPQKAREKLVTVRFDRRFGVAVASPMDPGHPQRISICCHSTIVSLD